MIIEELTKRLTKNPKYFNEMFSLNINDKYVINIYSNSLIEDGTEIYLIAKDKLDKYLFVFSTVRNSDSCKEFDGEEIENLLDSSLYLKKCFLNYKNALLIQSKFEFTKPALLANQNSFGFGDRLGLANAAHIRSLEGSNFKPILAQQSIRELNRSNRKPADVISAAVWAVFQEGYKGGYGADADHLKTTDDIDLMIEHGFTFFTFDPSDYVINDADILSENYLLEKIKDFNPVELHDSLDNVIKTYERKVFKISESFSIYPDSIEILRTYVKYTKALKNIEKLYDHLTEKHSSKKYEVEISIDETKSITTPFEHFFISNELKRLGIKIISLAPHFIGGFEKGIDYKDDLDVFEKDFIKHALITNYFGGYKISLHSGSDKFSVYNIIGSLELCNVHVKTAGTSYLEALKTISIAKPELFREILEYSRTHYEIEKKTYHVSANLDDIKPDRGLADDELPLLFYSDNARQVLHVTFGKVLTTKDESGNYLFRDRILKCLKDSEDLHYELLFKHFQNHLIPFNKFKYDNHGE